MIDGTEQAARMASRWMRWRGLVPSDGGVTNAGLRLAPRVRRRVVIGRCPAADGAGVPHLLREDTGLLRYCCATQRKRQRWYSCKPLAPFMSRGVDREVGLASLRDTVAEQHGREADDLLDQISQVEPFDTRSRREALPPPIKSVIAPSRSFASRTTTDYGVPLVYISARRHFSAEHVGARVAEPPEALTSGGAR